MAGLDDILKDISKSEFGDVLKIIVVLIPLIQGLCKDIKKAKETGDDQEVQDKILNLDTERIRRLILGDL